MMPNYFPLHTFTVIVNDFICVKSDYVQFRFRKSKKRRAREKARKNKANWRHQNFQHTVYKIGNTIYCSSRDYKKIQEKFPTRTT